MNPRTLTERLIHARQQATTNQGRSDYDDELHTAAALLRTTHVNTVARVLDALVGEISAAREADYEAQAQRRGLA